MPHFADNIYREAQRLIALVEDIIKLSQLDENNVTLEKSPVDLYDLSTSVIERLAAPAQKRGVTMRLEGVHAEVCGIERILDEIIYNLCDNAIKYNRENGEVVLSVSKAEGHTRFTIRDTGIGIPPAHQERVFERFYRVDKSHSREIGGTGLGLSIVKHGVAYHDAALHLSSEPGRGTTVSIDF